MLTVLTLLGKVTDFREASVLNVGMVDCTECWPPTEVNATEELATEVLPSPCGRLLLNRENSFWAILPRVC